MPVEIEAKMKVDDHEPVRARLASCGARRLGRVLETNAFFDTSARDLLARGEGLRLRTTRDDANGVVKFVVTFKGPTGAGEMKRREELEFNVSDAGAATQLLARLGYHSDITFEKRRETWHLDGCDVELDELPELGRFVEIEGPSEEVVIGVRERLGLADCPLVKTPYVAMVAAFLKGQRGGTSTLKFA